MQHRPANVHARKGSYEKGFLDHAVTHNSQGYRASDIPFKQRESAAAEAEEDVLYQTPLMKMLISEPSNSDSEAIAVGTPAGDWRSAGPHSTAVSRSPTGPRERSVGDFSSFMRTASPESHPSDVSYEPVAGDAGSNLLTHKDVASQTSDLVPTHFVPTPTCDVDNFLASVAPALPRRNSCHSQLTLRDLWDWFLEPSHFGHKVDTLGCRLGRSAAFFVPLLSAMKLFSCYHSDAEALEMQGDAPRLDSAKRLRCEYSGQEAWPKKAQFLAYYNNRKLPWERPSIYHEIQALSCQEPTEMIPWPQALLNTRLIDIHPCSWLAVWWQPLYRIPEMPLEAKFLVYYSFKDIFHELWHESLPYLLMPVAGMLSGGVEIHASMQGSPIDEQWMRIHDSALPFVHKRKWLQEQQHRTSTMLRDLHTVAQQLTCNCQKDMLVWKRDGGALEDESHGDFTFLQRGRLGINGNG